MDTLALAIARKLSRFRLSILPPDSRRETLYLWLLRPVLKKLLLNNGSTDGATHFDRVVIVEPSKPCCRDDVKEILIIKCDHIGDFFISLWAFSILRKGFPGARISLLCASWNEGLALASGLFDRVACVDIFPETPAGSLPPFDPKVLAAYDFPQFDLAVDLRIDSDSRFLLDHVQARLKAGFESNSEQPSNRPALPTMNFAMLPPPLHCRGQANYARQTSLLLATFANGIVDLFKIGETPTETFSPYIERGGMRLSRCGKGPIIGICTGARLPTKEWPLKNYISLIELLIDRYDATIVLFGSEIQQPHGNAVLEKVEGNSGNVLNLIGATLLTELPGLVNQLDLYIGGDTALTHVAALLGMKTICLHSGVASIESFGTVGNNVTFLKCASLPCSPCFLEQLAQCSYGHKCMRSISCEEVFRQVETILEVPANIH
jgi:ADP-heptose:LPS heptosyltransferase